MTTPPVLFGQFGQTLAFAERALSAVLRRHLAERGIGPGLAREALSADLEGSRTLNADSTRDLLARLEADGLIRGDAELDLTPAGEVLHRSLREYIAGPRNALLSQFDVDDVETTIRTLQAITARAEEELTVAG